VGVTGPPGAGKSTLLSALLREWRRRGRTVAVLAVNPSSRRSGGSLLADRAAGAIGSPACAAGRP
jgi:LAO/AO transport system kinase